MFRAVFMVLLMVAAVVGFVVALVALIFRDVPLWSYRDQRGRKVHGFFAWWATVGGLILVVPVGLYAVLYAGRWIAGQVGSLTGWLGS